MQQGAAGRRLARRFGLWLLLMPFAACAPQAPLPAGFGPRPTTGSGLGALPGGAQPSRNRVALLLPLTGPNRTLGAAMLNAAQLALFDQADPRVEFLPRDTGGSAGGAANAARDALAEGARVIAGPLTLLETAAAAGQARGRGVPVFAFTSDTAQAGPGVWVLGVTPAEQVDRLVLAGTTAGGRRFGLLAPDDEFGRRLAQTLRSRLAALGLEAPVVTLHPPRGDAAVAARELANSAGPGGLDHVLLGQGGAAARGAAAALAAALPNPPRFMGTTLWAADPSVAREPALAGAWFPGADPAARAGFENRYAQAFGERPPRLAGVAYDAAALAARTARDGNLVPPIGDAFQGADGPLRLLPQGQTARGLALFALDPNGEPRLVEPAPLPSTSGT